RIGRPGSDPQKVGRPCNALHKSIRACARAYSIYISNHFLLSDHPPELEACGEISSWAIQFDAFATTGVPRLQERLEPSRRIDIDCPYGIDPDGCAATPEIAYRAPGDCKLHWLIESSVLTSG